MEIFDGHRALLRPLTRPAIALGNFDGVHVGHQELLRRTRAAAASRDGDVVLYTFNPHPAALLAPDSLPPLLTPLPRKLELIAEYGTTVAVIEPFTRELAELAPEAFHEILRETLGAEAIVVGYDFSYGKDRKGSPDTLARFCTRAGIDLDVVAAVAVDGVVASSSKIRELIGAGRMGEAAALLGRPFDLDGTVIRGAGRGRTIGVPTANIAPKTTLLPPPGVYAVRLRCLDEPASPARPGAANLGVNPTFGDSGGLSLEVHVLDFDGDLYDRPVRVELVERLRAERRFSGPEELVEQIGKDIEVARHALANPA